MSTDTLPWSKWAMEKSINFFRESVNVLNDSYETLTEKSYRSLSLNGVIVALIFAALSFISGKQQIDSSNENILIFLGLLYAAAVITSTVFAIWIILPKGMGPPKIDPETHDRFRYEASENTADIILGTYVNLYDDYREVIKGMGIKVEISWISLSISIILIVLAIPFIIF